MFFLVLFAIAAVRAQGPDDYGYTWKTSNDAGGPVFNWIDITSTGTVVQGLADDNAVGPIPMGMDFHFYWSDFDQLKIGSNGWLSFSNTPNIASCFPLLPFADSKNNLVCPLMSDLNFANGSPGKIYTWHDQTPGDEKFIISYENVTFWTQANPIFGTNTFQVILSKADSSITFQYADMEPDFSYNCGSGSKVVGGIENLTGQIGLTVFDGTLPPSNFAIKFYYPEVVTLSIFDVAPVANQNNRNEGVFLVPDQMVTLTTTIANTGNTDVSTDIAVGGIVRSFISGATVYSDVQGITGGLPVGSEQTVSFAPEVVDWGPGVYYFDVQTGNDDDINPGNDLNTTEINVINTDEERTALGYVFGQNAAGLIQWTGGGNGTSGGGIEIEPPFYPATLTGFELALGNTATDGFTIRIFDNDGPDGGPGTELATESIPPGGYMPAQWNQYDLETPVTISDGSIFIGWYMEGNQVSLLVEGEGPLSNRSYEILSNSWAKYRSAADLMLRGIFDNPFYTATRDIVTDSQLRVYPNPNNGGFFIDNTRGNLAIENIRLTNTPGAVVFENKKHIAAGDQWEMQTTLEPGLYYLQLQTTDNRRIVRKVVVQ